MKLIPQILLSAFLVVIIDAIYLNAMKDSFGSMVTSIQRVVMKVKILPAILCYLLIIFGLNYFILNKRQGVLEAFLLGFVIYGIFDMTNMALFKKYKWNLAIIDSLWGGVLFALTTAIVNALR
jgi:uncharacterized membrane protein|tara:strand:- start:15164 stop:15532 length:369 start_codon:yes stop_codon:yes gene_type:complete